MVHQKGLTTLHKAATRTKAVYVLYVKICCQKSIHSIADFIRPTVKKIYPDHY